MTELHNFNMRESALEQPIEEDVGKVIFPLSNAFSDTLAVIIQNAKANAGTHYIIHFVCFATTTRVTFIFYEKILMCVSGSSHDIIC